MVDDSDAWFAPFAAELPRRSASREQPLRVLALSGGGAGGGFGAGALVGLTQARARPVFDMVTGVSTGALIAPFAFVGSGWDPQLTRAYTGSDVSELLALSKVRPGRSLYPAVRLVALVKRYLDHPLLDAVAHAHSQGRRLFVATANLDAQSTSIWDMGAIASIGGPAALQLFEDVLVASASLPGLFPPKMIAVSAGSGAYEEMHVDGGAISPLFVMPQPLVLDEACGWGATHVEVYALVNTTLRAIPRTTPVGALSVLTRSFELMLRSSYRNALRAVAAFCELNSFELRTACVPEDFEGGSMLRFEHDLMARMFDAGAGLATAGELWREMPPWPQPAVIAPSTV